MTEQRPRPGPLERLHLIGMDGVTEVVLVRHAEQAQRIGGRFEDFHDPPLSERGREQARLAGEALANVRIDAVFSSGLVRALETARAIAGHHGLEPSVIEDLREAETFANLPPDQAVEDVLSREQLRALGRRMAAERSIDVYPYSERGDDFRKRAVNAVEEAIWTRRAERIAVVCHSGVINAYVSHVVKSAYDMVFGPAHASFSVVAASEDRRVLRSLNETDHLRADGMHSV